MRLLLLGCSGFVGRDLVPYLLELGHQCTLVSRRESPQPVPPGERLVRVTDPDDPFGWPDISLDEASRLMPGADISAPPPGAYIRRVVEAWAATGSLPG